MDTKIISLIQSQSDEGLRLLQSKYLGLMRYIVANILHDDNDTQECINDVCMKVWNSIESYSPSKGKFSTWLTAIARNTALNYLNRRQIVHDELKDNIADTTSLEGHILRQERIAELKRAISILSTEESHLFYRKYYYMQRTSQIAAELGMTERSVEGRLYRLRKKLQNELKGYMK